MPANLPQTVAQTLFRRLESFFSSGEVPSAFEKRQMERDALALAKVDAADASHVRAGLAALEWDIPTMRAQLANACLLEPTARSYINAALTSRFANDLTSAVEYAYKSLALAPNDAEIVAKAADYVGSAGRLRDAKKILDRESSMGLKMTNAHKECEALVALADRLGIDEQILQQQIKIAIDLLSEKQVRYLRMEYDTHVDPDGGTSLIAEIEIRGSLELVMDLEDQLAARLCEEESWRPNVLSIEYTSLSEDALQAA